MASSFVTNELNEVLTTVCMPQIKCLPLQEYRQLCLDLDQIRREAASLRQKLCHARRNLEEETRKRRMIERHKNLLESQINITREVLFHGGEANLNEDIKEKLQFLKKPEMEFKYNNVNIQTDKRTVGNGHLTTIVETDSTGSILSDLNCLSKSEDDLDTARIIEAQREKKWKEYEASSGEYFMTRHGGTLDKIAEFNSSDGATGRRNPKDSARSVPIKIQRASTEENIRSTSNAEASSANHSFISKIVIKPETCTPCGKRIRFGKITLKCRACPVTCHTECRVQVVSIPCNGGKASQAD